MGIMGRRDAERLPQSLEVKIPTLFRCPISLEVMRSPVSLFTGVTYDRTSIQRWLDSGHTTCPATMQPLPSTDLVPNLTLRRLINLWSSSSSSSVSGVGKPSSPSSADHVRELQLAASATDPLPLRRLADFISDPSADDFSKNALLAADGFPAAVVPHLFTDPLRDAAVDVLAAVSAFDSIDPINKGKLITYIDSRATLERFLNAIVATMATGALELRCRSARILDFVLPSSRSVESEKIMVSAAGNAALLRELIQLVMDDKLAADPALSCLSKLSSLRRARPQLVKLGAVAAAARALAAPVEAVGSESAECALKVMEAATGSTEGRAAICEVAEEAMTAVVGRMMKVGMEGREAAVTVLWSVCHMFPDHRAREAVAAADGAVTKILLLMQSDCSPAVRMMTGDLLKIFKVNTKSRLAGYDTKTTHIMPF